MDAGRFTLRCFVLNEFMRVNAPNEIPLSSEEIVNSDYMTRGLTPRKVYDPTPVPNCKPLSFCLHARGALLSFCLSVLSVLGRKEIFCGICVVMLFSQRTHVSKRKMGLMDVMARNVVSGRLFLRPYQRSRPQRHPFGVHGRYGERRSCLLQSCCGTFPAISLGPCSARGEPSSCIASTADGTVRRWQR